MARISSLRDEKDLTMDNKNTRIPTDEELKRLDKAEKALQQSLDNQKDWTNKLFPTWKSMANKDVERAKKELNAIPPDIREYKKSTGKKRGGLTKLAAGGSVSNRADGCAKRGKTRGKMV